MARNSLLIKNTDEFLRLAQQGTDPEDDQEDQEETLDEKIKRLTNELQIAQRQYNRQQRQNQRQRPAQEPQEQPQAQPQQQQAQPQAPQQAEQTPEQIVLAGLTNEVYASLNKVGNGIRGVFTPEVANTVNNIVYKNLFKSGLFGGKEDEIKKFVIQQRVRFDVRVFIYPNMAVNTGIEVTNQNYKTQYAQFFSKAEQELKSYLQPIIYNIAQSALRTNNLDPKIEKQLVIDSWFSVDNSGKLVPIA